MRTKKDADYPAFQNALKHLGRVEFKPVPEAPPDEFLLGVGCKSHEQPPAENQDPDSTEKG